MVKFYQARPFHKFAASPTKPLDTLSLDSQSEAVTECTTTCHHGKRRYCPRTGALLTRSSLLRHTTARTEDEQHVIRMRYERKS
jgi:hypothetical protein